MSASATPPPPSPGQADPAQWPTGRLLSSAARLVEGAWTQRLADHGLTHAGLLALHALAHHGPLPARELATQSQVTPQTMTRTLDRLERDGLVSRHRASQDRRRVAIRLTAQGRRAHDDAADMSAAEPDLLGDVVDVPALRNNLLAIIGHLSPDTGRSVQP